MSRCLQTQKIKKIDEEVYKLYGLTEEEIKIVENQKNQNTKLQISLFQLIFEIADIIIITIFFMMTFVMETQFFALCYKIKINSALGKIKKVDNAVAATLASIAIRLWNTCRPRFIAIFW